MNQIINVLILAKGEMKKLGTANKKIIDKNRGIVSSAIEAIFRQDMSMREKFLDRLKQISFKGDESAFEKAQNDMVDLIKELISFAEEKTKLKNK